MQTPAHQRAAASSQQLPAQGVAAKPKGGAAQAPSAMHPLRVAPPLTPHHMRNEAPTAAPHLAARPGSEAQLASHARTSMHCRTGETRQPGEMPGATQAQSAHRPVGRATATRAERHQAVHTVSQSSAHSSMQASRVLMPDRQHGVIAALDVEALLAAVEDAQGPHSSDWQVRLY